MTVYVLMLDYGIGETAYLRGVYSTLESAEESAELVAKDTDRKNIVVYPVTLDALPPDIFECLSPVAP